MTGDRIPAKSAVMEVCEAFANNVTGIVDHDAIARRGRAGPSSTAPHCPPRDMQGYFVATEKEGNPQIVMLQHNGLRFCQGRLGRV